MQPRADFLGGEDRTGRAPLRRVHGQRDECLLRAYRKRRGREGVVVIGKTTSQSDWWWEGECG